MVLFEFLILKEHYSKLLLKLTKILILVELVLTELEIWVITDSFNRTIHWWTPDGEDIRRTCFKPEYTWGVKINPKNGNMILVSDKGLRLLSPDGTVLKTGKDFGFHPAPSYLPATVDIDCNGNFIATVPVLYACGQEAAGIYIFNEQGEFIQRIGNPDPNEREFDAVNAIIDPEGNIWISDSKNQRIVIWG